LEVWLIGRDGNFIGQILMDLKEKEEQRKKKKKCSVK